MAHDGTSSATARKAQASLHGLDVREVSTVDRPAIGEPFLLLKSEGGVAAKKTTGAAAPVKKDELADAAPKPKVMPSGEPQPADALEAAAPAVKDGEETDGEVSMALPVDAKTALITGLAAAADRIADLLALATGASDAIAVDGEPVPEVPGDYLVKVLDVAGGLAKLVEPYAGSAGMVDDTEKGADGKPVAPMAKADGAPNARCTWTEEYINSLSDWCFLDVTPSMDRDTEYRTTPLSNRHFPVRDHDGRMCLAAVLDAIDALSQPSPALAPWLTDSKRLMLLLHLACERLHEVKVALRRDGPSPESTAELGAIAEMLTLVGASGAPAAAAPGAEAAAPAAAPAAGAPGAPEAKAADGSQPIGPTGATNEPATQAPPKDVPLLKAAEILRRVAKNGAAPMLPEHHAALKAAHVAMAKAMGGMVEAGGHLEKCLKAVDPYFEGKLGDASPQAEFGTPPAAGAPNPSGAAARPADTMAQPADAGVAKALADIRVQLAKAQADNAALKQRVAKAERAVPASRLNGGEPEVQPVAKGAAKPTPLSMDLNEEIKAEELAKGAGAAPARVR